MPREYLSERQWERIKELMPGKPTDPGVTARDNRQFVAAVCWILRTGAPWRDLPETYGKWNTVYQRFRRWAKTGVWQRVLVLLQQEADLEWLMLDSSVIRAHQHAAGAKGGKSSRPWGAPAGASPPRFM